jgi:hypothetical protein
MVRLQTDADGKLLAFEAVPPQVEKPAPPAPAFDWSRLFTAAGLNLASFQATEPTWTPLLSWDARAAWTGTDPATGASLRVEAAAWRGKPVFFRIIGPWTVANRMTSSASNMPLSVFFIVYGAIIAACVIGWLNHRAGRLDAQGATRLFLLYCLSAVSGLISAHHVATQSELNQFWMIVSAALINGMIVWLFYAALEPWVRRKWPQTVISWSRYVSRGIRDPLVGRDLLYGIVFGLIMHLAGVVSPTLHGNSGHPSFPPLETLTSGRLEIAALINTIPPAVISSTLFFFVLFVLRLMIRNQWATAIVFVAMVSFAFTSDTTTPAVDYSLAVVAYSVYAFAMMRCGLLAALVSSATAEVLLLGTPLDFSAWYAGMAAVPLLLVLGVAVYAFKTSLGGRRLFQLEA